MRRWLNRKSAGQYAGGVCPKTIDRWRQRGLKYVKVGKEVLFKPEWLDQFIEEQGSQPDLDQIVAELMSK